MRELSRELPRHRFTADEVLRMVEVGVLDEDAPVELLDGELVTSSPQGPRHSRLAVLIRDLLARALGSGVHLQAHSPIDAGPWSLPEPDVAVVRGDARALLDRHPRPDELVVVLEISVTSQSVDRAKAELYARAGVARYWNVDVGARTLRDHADPDPVAGEYRRVTVVGEADGVALEGLAVRVADLLP